MKPIMFDDFEALLQKLTINVETLKKYIELYTPFITNVEGMWFISGVDEKQIVGNVYLGQNKLTDLYEGYMTVFVNQNLKVTDIENCFEEMTQFLRKHINLDWLYYEVFPENHEMFQIVDDYFSNHTMNYRIYSAVVKKHLDQSSSLKSCVKSHEHLSIRKAEEEDIEHIMPCIVKASQEALPGDMKKKISMEQFTQRLKEYFTPFLKDRVSFVCEMEREFIGHASYEFKNDRMNLLDIYVLNDYTSQGIGTLLASVGEYQLSKKYHIREVYGTVNGTTLGEIDVIVKRLKKEDWDQQSVVYSRCLP